MEAIKGGQRPASDPDHKVLRSIFFGEGGVGKSTAALTFPPPLYILNCDKPIGDLLTRLPANYDVFYERLVFDDVDTLTPQMAKQYLATANAMVRKALKEGEGGTLFIDGADNLHQAVTIALLPANDPGAWAYASVNSWWDSHYRRCSGRNINWVMTTFSKAEWGAGGAPSGRQLMEGWKWMKRWLVQAAYFYIKTATDPTTFPTDRPTGGVNLEFRTQITEAKEKKALIGRTMSKLSYKLLYKLYYGELPPNHEQLWTPEYQ